MLLPPNPQSFHNSASLLYLLRHRLSAFPTTHSQSHVCFFQNSHSVYQFLCCCFCCCCYCRRCFSVLSHYLYLSPPFFKSHASPLLISLGESRPMTRSFTGLLVDLHCVLNCFTQVQKLVNHMTITHCVPVLIVCHALRIINFKFRLHNWCGIYIKSTKN